MCMIKVTKVGKWPSFFAKESLVNWGSQRPSNRLPTNHQAARVGNKSLWSAGVRLVMFLPSHWGLLVFWHICKQTLAKLSVSILDAICDQENLALCHSAKCHIDFKSTEYWNLNLQILISNPEKIEFSIAVVKEPPRWQRIYFNCQRTCQDLSWYPLPS